MRLFLFRVRRNDAHGGPLKGGAPTVGALGDDTLDENRWAINRHLQVSWVLTAHGNSATVAGTYFLLSAEFSLY